jgi:thymidylate synthase (FAD)
MKLRVYLIATSKLITDGMAGVDQFLSDHQLTWDRSNDASDSERLVEVAGRVCYMSFGQLQRRRSNSEYIINLLTKGHESVLEHATFTLLVSGISRALSHQIVRHRVGFAYSQLSQQYHDESETDFVEPPGLSQHPRSRQLWREFVARARETYRQLLEDLQSDSNGRAAIGPNERLRLLRSIARSVLPNATSTTLAITGNARAWRHVLTVRGGIEGDVEMREYCVAVYEALRGAAPTLFRGFEVAEDGLGKFVRGTQLTSS